MSPEAQRIAIAEACGWTLVGLRLPRVSSGRKQVIGIHPGKLGEQSEWDMEQIPNYLGDLNAMHEAEEILTKLTDWSLFAYVLALHEMTSSWVFNATASQRAEAFLRTLGKWEDSE